MENANLISALNRINGSLTFIGVAVFWLATIQMCSSIQTHDVRITNAHEVKPVPRDYQRVVIDQMPDINVRPALNPNFLDPPFKIKVDKDN